MVSPASAVLGASPGGAAAVPNVVGLGSTWAFSDSVAQADPGTATFRLNNAAPTSATALFISDLADSGVDLSTLFDELKFGDRLYMQDRVDKAKFQLFLVIGPAIDNTSWHEVPIVSIDTGTDFADADLVTFSVISPTQDLGDALTSRPYQGGSVMPVDDASVDRLIGAGTLVDGAVTTTAGSTFITHPATGSIYTVISPGASATDQGFFSTLSTIYGPEVESECLVKFHFDDDDRSRLWIGFAAAAGAALNTDAPAGAVAALRFSQGDTKFQFVSQGAGTSVVDSTITPVNGTTYYIKISLTLTNAIYTLYDANFAILATFTETTNHPNSGSIMRWHIYTENQGVGAARDIGVYFGQVQNRAIA